MALNRPFRRRGSPKTDILEHFRPWLLQTPPGSYRFAVRWQKPVQISLFPEASPAIEDITQQFMQIVHTATQESREDLEHTIPDQDYRSGFIEMSRNLAPTGKTFTRLEITSIIDPDISVVLLPESRVLLNGMLRHERENVDVETQEEQMAGVLRALHLDADWLSITSDDGSPVRIDQTGDVIDDIVESMVNQRVIVSVAVNQKTGQRLYRDIQLEE
jgi:hypothetical protein